MEKALPIVITLDAQLKVHYHDREKTKESLIKYIGIYEAAPETEKIAFRIENLKSLVKQLEN